MSKRAILKIPAVNEDGSSYELALTLQETTTEGRRWEWHLPQHFGWGPNDIGVFTKNPSEPGTVFCMDNQGTNDSLQIQGVVPRGIADFPFAPEDQVDQLSGTLVVQVANHYLQPGSYSWRVDSVVI